MAAFKNDLMGRLGRDVDSIPWPERPFLATLNGLGANFAGFGRFRIDQFSAGDQSRLAALDDVEIGELLVDFRRESTISMPSHAKPSWPRSKRRAAQLSPSRAT